MAILDKIGCKFYKIGFRIAATNLDSHRCQRWHGVLCSEKEKRETERERERERERGGGGERETHTVRQTGRRRDRQKQGEKDRQRDTVKERGLREGEKRQEEATRVILFVVYTVNLETKQTVRFLFVFVNHTLCFVKDGAHRL